MSNTRKQKENERFADELDDIRQGAGTRLRKRNRAIDARKSKQRKKARN